MTLMFESLPNEIWFMIFAYLSSRHIWRAFFPINRRLNELLTSDLIRHTIDLRDVSYSEIVELLDDCDNNSYGQWQAQLVSRAHAICLENTFDYNILFVRWILTKTNWYLSSLRIIYVSPEALTGIWSLFVESKFRTLLESQIHCLHLVFDDPSCIYVDILSSMVRRRLSCSTMILEVTQGHYDQDPEYRYDLYDLDHQLCWIHTVRLTLSLQHSSKLILLLTPEALPLLEHLNVTIEQPKKDLPFKTRKSTAGVQLCEEDIRRSNADGTRLRSLVLRHIELDDLLVLFNSLTFSLLHTLTLVHVYDKSLDHLPAFQELVSPQKLPALKHQFQFLLRFPGKYENEWIRRFHNNGWPFDNTGSHVDEHLEVNEIDIVINPKQANPYCRLRSLTFRFKQHLPSKSSQHHSPLEIILAVSIHLSYLNVSWKDFSRCSNSYSMIKNVHLILKSGDHLNFDANHLNMLIPRVNYLAIGGFQLICKKRIINFVLRLLVDNNNFRQLVLLQVNADGNARLKPNVKVNIEEAIIAGIVRLQGSAVTRIEFSYHNQISIWLR